MGEFNACWGSFEHDFRSDLVNERRVCGMFRTGGVDIRYCKLNFR